MMTVETIGRIRRAHLVEGESIRGIARRLRLSRQVVRRAIASETGEFHYERNVQPLPKLGSHVADLNRLLEENERRQRRERLTLIRVWEELRGLGYEGGYDAVRRYARRWQRARDAQVAEAYVPLSFPPGEAYQFDWSHEVIVLAGVTTVVKVAHVRLCYSRMLFVRAYPREAQEMVFDAHDRAFAFFKGAAKHGIYDNMKTAVDGIFVGKERAYNRRFLAMCSHYLVEPRACTPAAGWEKGQVENQVGVVRQRFFSPRLKFKSYAELNAYLLDRCVAHAQASAHPEQKEKTVFEVFEAERAALIAVSRPLRQLPGDGGLGLQDLPRELRRQQVLGHGQGGRPAGRHPCLCRAHRHPAGRRDRWRACSSLRQAPYRLRSLALRAGAGPQAGRAEERCSLQGLDATGLAGEGAPQARRVPGWRPTDGVDPDRRPHRRSSCCRSRLSGGPRLRHRQRRRHPEHPGAQPGTRTIRRPSRRRRACSSSTRRSPTVPATTT